MMKNGALAIMNGKQRNIFLNPPVPERCSEKEMSGKMDMNQLASSAHQLVVDVPCQPQCDGFRAYAILHRVVITNFFPFPRLKSVLKQ
jgi:hypothetical protein